MNTYITWETDKNLNHIENTDKFYTGNSIKNVAKLIAYETKGIMSSTHTQVRLENGNIIFIKFFKN